jgi:RNA polymerase sigma-70 factor (ECF subfamily)
MTRILLNVINDTVRKRVRQTDMIVLTDECDEIAAVEDHCATSQDPQLQIINNEVDPHLLEALKRLPTSLLYPLLLRELEEMTYQDIATMLDVPTGTVMSRLFRARRTVKDCLTRNVQRSTQAEAADHGMQ